MKRKDKTSGDNPDILFSTKDFKAIIVLCLGTQREMYSQ